MHPVLRACGAATGRALRSLGVVGLLLLSFLPTARAQSTGPLVGTLPGSLSVDNKGSANYSIPLSIAPGRGGMQPSVSLSYSSGGGNGPLGIGFSLSTGFPQSITRGRSILARDGVTQGVTFTSADKFYLDGKRLICVAGTYGSPGSTYRTEVDSFVTVTTTGTGSNIETFTVTDKSGTAMTFGKYAATIDGYQTGGWDQSGLAYAYALKRVQDTIGNSVDFTYAYTVAPPNTTSYDEGEYVLSQITYTGNSGQSVSPLAQVTFLYNVNAVAGSTARLDAPTQYMAGRRFPHNKRLDRIVAEFKPVSAFETIAQYDLEYECAPNSGPTRLKSLKPALRDPAGTVLREVPATAFTWNGAETAPSYTKTPNALYSATGFVESRVFADVNGDGRDDYIDTDTSASTVYVSLSNGTGFAAPVSWINISGLWTAKPETLKICDINGDGRKDLIYGSPLAGGANKLYALVSTGTEFVPLGGGTTATIIHSFTDEFEDPPPFTGNITRFQAMEGEGVTNRITVADFTGDGRDDILIHRYNGKLKLLKSAGASFVAMPEYDVGATSLFGLDALENGPPWT